MLKTCSTCGKTKPLDNFYSKAGRIVSPCKPCGVASSLEWARRNPEKRLSNVKRSAQRNRDRHNQQAREWSARNPEKKLESGNRWLANNPETRRRVAREYVKRNPDRLKEYDHRRRARRSGAEGSHTVEDIRRLYATQLATCANPKCLADLSTGYHVDHIVALSRGGSDYASNLQLLCPTCNRRKHAKSPERWALENGIS